MFVLVCAQDNKQTNVLISISDKCFTCCCFSVKELKKKFINDINQSVEMLPYSSLTTKLLKKIVYN